MVKYGQSFRRRTNQHNAAENRRRKHFARLDLERGDPFLSWRRMTINSMTNWQRNQWARAGYPKGNDKIQHYADLNR